MKKISYYCIAYLAKWILALILKTCRIEIKGLEDFIETSRQGKCILMLWHNRLPLAPEILTSYAPDNIYTAFVSNSRDGEPLAILANSYPKGKTVRVSHQARHSALLKMINLLKQGKETVVVTPDGPRGPRYRVKSGIIKAAQQSNALIIPFTWSASRFWQLKSWDKMIFPKPFSKIQILFGASIQLLAEEKEAARLLEETLLAMDKEACLALSINSKDWPK